MLFASNGRVAAYFAAQGFRHWIFHLGALGFIPLGLLDSSVVPVPGSMDVLTILLSARERNLWPYYALMATIGSVVGALVTYRLARKGGQEQLAKRIKPKTLKKVQQLFERWGLAAIAIHGDAASARTSGSFRARRGSYPVSGQEVPVRTLSGPCDPLHDFGLPGGTIWPPHTFFLQAFRARKSDHNGGNAHYRGCRRFVCDAVETPPPSHCDSHELNPASKKFLIIVIV